MNKRAFQRPIIKWDFLVSLVCQLFGVGLVENQFNENT